MTKCTNCQLKNELRSNFLVLSDAIEKIIRETKNIAIITEMNKVDISHIRERIDELEERF